MIVIHNYASIMVQILMPVTPRITQGDDTLNFDIHIFNPLIFDFIKHKRSIEKVLSMHRHHHVLSN